ncbi:MAG TPA: DsbA family protein, partial [Herpetosiphonaceae bacterium]|nr:DsbA family protein [Herpetosiphonaceae bacterium]
LLVLAGEAGVQWPLATALFKAYFSDGADLNDRGQLLDIAEAAGLDRAAAERCLDSDLYADAVRQSQDSAGQIGVGGVPFYIFAERFAVSGAQPVGVFLRALEMATQG